MSNQLRLQISDGMMQNSYVLSIKILHYILALLYSNRGDGVMIEYATTAEELSGVEIGKPSVRP